MRRAALTFACALAWGPHLAAAPCVAPGEPIHWRADYCMLKMETDDEIAISECLESEGKRRFRDACGSNIHFKREMCALMIQNGTRTGKVEPCLQDPSFRGRTVERGGVGG
jgi:hypothetical protein